MGSYKPRLIIGEHYVWLLAHCRDGSHFAIAKLIMDRRGI